MANNLALSIKIGASSAEAQKALAGLVQSLKQMGATADKAGRDAATGLGKGRVELGGLAESIRNARTQLLGFLAAYVGIRSVVGLLHVADELNTLNARLRLVTHSSEEFSQAQSKIFDLAQRTRSSLQKTIDLYAQIANATKDAGVGQETLLGVVETINQAVQLSGASTQAADAALVQLGQGLASGALRGQELNSVLEQTPALADAIAKGMGVTRGELRQMGQDGKISAEQVINALLKQRDVVAQQFAQLPITVGQSVTLLKNAGTELIGAFDTASGSTRGLASVIKDLADFLSGDEVAGAVVQFSVTWSDAFAQMARDAAEAVQIMEAATGNIAGTGENVVALLGRSFTELPVNIRTAVRIATVQIISLLDKILAAATFYKDAVKAVFTDDTIEASFKRYERRVEGIEGAARDTVDSALAERENALKDADAARKKAEDDRKRAREGKGSTSTGTFLKKQSDADKRSAEALRQAQLDAEEKLVKDSAKRQLATVDQLYQDSKLAAADYYKQRAALELASLDQAIAVEKKRAATGDRADKAKALAEITILEREKADVVARSAHDRLKAEEELAKSLEELRARDLSNTGRTAEAAKSKITAEFHDLLKRLEAEGNTAGVALIQKIINTESARAQFKDLEDQANVVLERLQTRQQSLQLQQQTGAVPADTAASQQSAARQQAIAELTTLNEKMQELAASTNDPKIIQGAQQAANALQQLAVDGATGLDKAIIELRSSLANLQADLARSVTNAGVDALTGFFTDIATNSKSAGDALKDFVRGFAQSMAQIAAKAIATFLVLQGLDAIYPGLGRLVASAGGIGANVKHSGGMVGFGPRRTVSPLLFAGAPRYHSGGFPGLQSNEVPAILQKGEEVLAKNDPRNAANGGAQPQAQGVRIVNVIDPAMAGDYLNSSAGERTVLNVLRRNAGAVKQALA